VSSQFVISLDFELLRGVRDHADRRSYGDNVLGARIIRKYIPAAADCTMSPLARGSRNRTIPVPKAANGITQHSCNMSQD